LLPHIDASAHVVDSSAHPERTPRRLWRSPL